MGAEVAARHGYEVSFAPVGPDDPEVGPPTQLAHFRMTDEGSSHRGGGSRREDSNRREGSIGGGSRESCGSREEGSGEGRGAGEGGGASTSGKEVAV